MVVISSVVGEDDRVVTSEFGGATVGLKVWPNESEAVVEMENGLLGV